MALDSFSVKFTGQAHYIIPESESTPQFLMNEGEAGIFAWATLPASVGYNALMVEAGLSVAGLCDNRLPDLQAANTD